MKQQPHTCKRMLKQTHTGSHSTLPPHTVFLLSGKDSAKHWAGMLGRRVSSCLHTSPDSSWRALYFSFNEYE